MWVDPRDTTALGSVISGVFKHERWSICCVHKGCVAVRVDEGRNFCGQAPAIGVYVRLPELLFR